MIPFSSWNPRDCDPLITFMEVWTPILPQWVLDNIYDQLIMPRIMTEVNNWNPLTDTTPIHVWVHPWIPLLSELLLYLIESNLKRFLFCFFWELQNLTAQYPYVLFFKRIFSVQ